jgi:hypothetical protein
MVGSLGVKHFTEQRLNALAASTFRPASVIRTRATSILREPATTRSAVAVASRAADKLNHLADGESARAKYPFSKPCGPMKT